jgi:hypothetical protein
VRLCWKLLGGGARSGGGESAAPFGGEPGLKATRGAKRWKGVMQRGLDSNMVLRHIEPNPRRANPGSGEPVSFGANPAVIRRRRSR